MYKNTVSYSTVISNSTNRYVRLHICIYYDLIHDCISICIHHSSQSHHSSVMRCDVHHTLYWCVLLVLSIPDLFRYISFKFHASLKFHSPENRGLKFHEISWNSISWNFKSGFHSTYNQGQVRYTAWSMHIVHTVYTVPVVLPYRTPVQYNICTVLVSSAASLR